MLAWGMIRVFFTLVDGQGLRQVFSTLVLGGGLVIFAHAMKPGGYSVETAPEVVISVAQRLF